MDIDHYGLLLAAPSDDRRGFVPTGPIDDVREVTPDLCHRFDHRITHVTNVADVHRVQEVLPPGAQPFREGAPHPAPRRVRGTLTGLKAGEGHPHRAGSPTRRPAGSGPLRRWRGRPRAARRAPRRTASCAAGRAGRRARRSPPARRRVLAEPCCRAGHPADRLLHQRAAEVVDAALRASRGSRRRRASPRSVWMLSIRAVQQQPRHRVHGAVLAQRRARAGDAGQVDRRVVVHERQRHELGEAARLAPGCDRPAAAGGRPSARGCRRGRTSSSSSIGRPTACAVVTTSIQVAAGSLPLVSTQRTSSSRISAAVPGMESSAGLLAPRSASRGSTARCGPRR